MSVRKKTKELTGSLNSSSSSNASGSSNSDGSQLRSQLRPSRQGFFFIIDTLLALIVLFAGLALVLSNSAQVPLTAQAAYTAQDLLTQLSNTRINESSNAVVIAARFNGTISSNDNYRSLLEEIVYLYYQSNTGTAVQILNATAVNLIPSNYNAEFRINQTLIFNQTVTANSQAQAPFVLTDRRIIIGITNTSQLFGPYIVEFRIWQ